MPTACAHCNANRAVVVRPKNHQKLCKQCFIAVFEAEIHQTITTNHLFARGERVAIGASGGKDSTVLASVLKTLNERHDYGIHLILLSIDEGIRGYRDDSLETVKRNAIQYEMELKIVGYGELYGWTMDQVVEQVGKKGNCTYCGVFRRQALDRGAAMLGVEHVVTGHNADDMAETVLMNLLRGDIARLSRTTSIVTSTPNAASSLTPNGLSHIKRSKPLKYAYEKEIVLYAHHKSLDYFSTECIYSPEAFRGSARTLIKDLERVRPTTILDIVRSGEDMACLCPGYEEYCKSGCSTSANALEEAEGGCGSAVGRNAGGEMRKLDEVLSDKEPTDGDISITAASDADIMKATAVDSPVAIVPTNNSKPKKQSTSKSVGQCARCGYMSSQRICKACVLLEGLNRSRPKIDVGTPVQ